MTIFYVIALGISIYAIIDRKKAFVLYLCFRLFLNINTAVNYGGLPNIPLDFLIAFVFLFLSFTKGDYKRFKTYPLIKPTIFFITVDIVTSLFSIQGFFRCFTSTLIHICDLLVLMLIWLYINNETYKKLIYGLICIAIMASVYGIYERFIEFNPLIAYESANGAVSDDSWMDLLHYGDRGYRIQSIFSHPIGAGANFGFLAFLFIYTWKFTNILYKNETFVALLAGVLCCVCVVFSNCRSALVYMIVAAIPVFSLKDKRTYLIMLLLFILITLFGDVFASYLQNFKGLLDFDNKQNMSGSSLSMRFNQLDAAIQIWSKSPITGLGTRGYEYYPNKGLAAQLLGLESVWIGLLVEKGILGIFAYVYFIKSCFSFDVSRRTKRGILYLMFALLLLQTITSLPGAYLFIHYTIVFLMVKTDPIFRTKKFKHMTKF